MLLTASSDFIPGPEFIVCESATEYLHSPTYDSQYTSQFLLDSYFTTVVAFLYLYRVGIVEALKFALLIEFVV